MFMVSVRLKKRRVLLAAAGIILLAVFAVMGGRMLWGGETVETGGGKMQEAGQPAKGKTNEQRLEFIASFGWEVEEEPVEVMEVIIPKEFDKVYEEYNSMQQKMGYDLSKHAGKRCKRYTYVISNYPGQAEDVRLNLLVRDNKVIGGDVCSLKPGGFMHDFYSLQELTSGQKS